MATDPGAPEASTAIGLLATRRPDVVALAEVVSPAVYVEPALLRRARYELLPQAGAEAEAGLWLGPLAAPSRRGLVFTAAVVPLLRARLAADPGRFHAAADLVAAAHAGAAPSVRLEEEIIRLSLTDSPDSVLEERLAEIAAAMVQEPGRATDIARWLMLALPRLPERARRSPAAWALSLRAGEQLGSPAPLREPPALGLGRWRAFAAARRPGGVPAGVHLLGDGLRVGGPAEPAEHRIVVPPTSPRIVEVGLDGALMSPVSFRDDEQRHVPVSTLQLWSRATGDLRLSWPDRITAVAAAPDGQSVAVGFATGRAELRDARTGALRTSRAFGSPVTALALAGTQVFAGTADGTGAWDTAAGPSQVRSWGDAPVTALAVPAGGRYIVAAGGRAVDTYELPGGSPITSGGTEAGEITAVAAAGDMVALLAGGMAYFTGPGRLWVKVAPPSEIPGRRIAAPADDLLAVLGADGQVRAWRPPAADGSIEALGVVARGAGPVLDIAAAGGALVTAGTDRLLRRWTGPGLAEEAGRERYEGRLGALAGAAAADLVAGACHGGPLTLRSLAGDAWRLEPVAADDGPLGALADGAGTRFALFSAVAERVELCLFDLEGRETRITMTPTGAGVWQFYAPGIQPGHLYGFRIHGPYDPPQGDRCSPAKLLLDPYATAIEGQVDWNEALFGFRTGDPGRVNDYDSATFMPASVVTSGGFGWGDDRPPRTPYQDTVIYEAHVRGLTMRHPDVPPGQRGTYAGLAHPAVITHLARLGVTAVQLMPVQQFVTEQFLAERGRTNYWGYNTISFCAPHNGYAAATEPGGSAGEFKAMVKALHAAGIEVILDVAHNHTAEGNHLGPTLSFRGIDNAAYYRLADDAKDRYVDYTGTGNSLNMASPRVLQLILDSLRYWVTQMHVDGFRFDLTSALVRELHDAGRLPAFFGLLRQDPVLAGVKLFGDGWDVGAGGYQAGTFPPLWFEWNDSYRDTVRDFWRGRANLPDLAASLSGSPARYGPGGDRPLAPVNFVTSHDGFTLTDLVSYDRKHNEANGEDGRDGTDDNRSWNCGAEGPADDPAIVALRERQRRNFLATLLLSRGIPVLLAGDELGHTQGGNNNAYCQDNEVSWLDWAGLTSSGLPEFIALLTRLRQDYPVLRRASPGPGAGTDIVWLDPDGTLVASADWDQSVTAIAACLGPVPPDTTGEPGPSLLLLLNGGGENVTFSLPGATFAGAWTVLIDTGSGQPATGPDLPAAGEFTTEARSLVLLVSQPAAPESAAAAESGAAQVPEPGVAETEYAVETE